MRRKWITIIGLGMGLLLMAIGLLTSSRIPGASGSLFIIASLATLAWSVSYIERERFAEKLRVTETRFQALADHTPMLIWRADIDGQATYFNRGWQDFTGQTLEELLGMGWIGVVHPEDLSQAIESIVENRLSRKPFVWEYRLRRYDGIFRWLLIQGAPMAESDGSCSGWIGSCLDITDRKRAENLFRVMVELAPFGVLLIKPDGTIELANALAEQILQQSRDGLLNTNIDEILMGGLPLDDASQMNYGSMTCIELNKVRREEVTATTRDGHILSLEIGLTPIRMENGNFIMLSVQDIGEQLRSRQAINHAKELAEAANLAKSNFLAMISHELRTPINGILGMCELLAKSNLQRQQTEYVELIQYSSDTLLSVIRNILDVSKIEVGKFELEATPFSLRQQINNTLQPLKHKSNSKGLTLSWTIAEEIPDYLIGDGERLGQILTNLVSNSIKFTESGTIQIDLQCEDWADDLVMIKGTVKDSGIGISREHRERIFLAFEQVDASRNRAHDGAGLGLAIVSKLVELMNGRVWVESEIGEGSCFHFAVELAWAGEDARNEQAAHISRILSPSRILIAEDNPVSQRVMVESLRLEGHDVHVVGTGKQAIDSWLNGMYDLILMDVRMPEMDGLEATRQIRFMEESNGCHIPIIALTAQAMRGDAEQCLAAGCDAYHSKPVRRKELIRTMTRLLGRPVQGCGAIDPLVVERMFGTAPYDSRQALAQCQGNSKLYHEVTDLFLSECPRLMLLIEDAIDERDANALVETAHSLKGSASYLAARPTVELAHELELIGRTKNWTQVEEIYVKLRQESERLRNALLDSQSRVVTK
jgi:PAS domain S-box-containing protein